MELSSLSGVSAARLENQKRTRCRQRPSSRVLPSLFCQPLARRSRRKTESPTSAPTQTTAGRQQRRYLLAFFAYSGCNLVLAAFAAIIWAYIAPVAAGSDIPEVKAYLNRVDAPSILAPNILFVKIFGSIRGVSAAGFVIGKEGPMVHTGSCIGSGWITQIPPSMDMASLLLE